MMMYDAPLPSHVSQKKKNGCYELGYSLKTDNQSEGRISRTTANLTELKTRL